MEFRYRKMKLNFGAGKKILEGYENVDIQSGGGIDRSFDFTIFPYPYAMDTFEYILCDNVLEHLEAPEKVMDELWRISKPNGIIHIITPNWNSKTSWNDLTHKHHFNDRAFELLCGIEHSYRNYSVKRFEIIELKRVPIKALKWLPKSLLRKVGNYICNVIETLDVKIKVIK